MEFYTHTLPNGIRCIHKRVKSAVSYCALTIGAGSRDELPGEQGIAHLTEHTLFKGTEHRKAYHINCRLENLGGELNAFTTKEETVVHATTLRGDFPKAAELIADLVFHSVFPTRELEKEKEVIVDEINSYKDSPAERIFDDFEELLFSRSPLGHNILGTKSAILRYGREDILRFTSRTYNTDQMIFSSIGNVSEKNFVRTVEKYLGGVGNRPRTFVREAPGAYVPFHKTVNRNTHQAHCIVGGRAYSINDPHRITLSLLTNLLGGPSANSLLNVALREKNGLSYSVEAGYSPLNDSGIFTIYFGTDRDKTDRCMEIVDRQLSQLKSTPLSARRLSMAKKQYLGQLAIAMESNEGYMLGAAKSYLVYGHVDEIGTVCRKIAAITREQIQEVANDLFTDTSVLLYK